MNILDFRVYLDDKHWCLFQIHLGFHDIFSMALSVHYYMLGGFNVHALKCLIFVQQQQLVIDPDLNTPVGFRISLHGQCNTLINYESAMNQPMDKDRANINLEKR